MFELSQINRDLFELLNCHSSPIVDTLALWFTTLFSFEWAWLYAAPYALWVFLKNTSDRVTLNDARGLARWKQWSFFVGSLAITMGITGVLKLFFNAPRPLEVLGPSIHIVGTPQHWHSFPSGHAALAGMVLALFWRHCNAYGKAGLIGGLVSMIYARVLMGAHFPLDVLAGAFIGLSGPTVTRHLSSLVLDRKLARKRRAAYN